MSVTVPLSCESSIANPADIKAGMAKGTALVIVGFRISNLCGDNLSPDSCKKQKHTPSNTFAIRV
jgi:hypothetical protein